MNSYLPRTAEKLIQTTSAHFPVLLLTGARQVGKTTLLRHLAEPSRTYVPLDDPTVREAARTDPAGFVGRFPRPLLVDEIQYAPELLSYVKMDVDNDRQPGAWWLTGSQRFQMMKGVSESLAGRVAILQLLGLSRREILGQGADAPPLLPTPAEIMERQASMPPLDLPAVYELIWRGSLPAVVLDPAVDRDLFYGSYLQTYLERDVHDLAQVGDEAAFLRFMRAAAARTAQLLNLSDLARDAGVAVNTIKSWLSILRASGIVYLLEPYHTNLSKRLVKAPKLYFLDTGLCSYLTQWPSPEVLEAGIMSGPMLETWVIGELLRSYWHNGKEPPFYYYHDHDRREIDLLIEQSGKLYPLEIKKTASPRADDARVFGALERLGVEVGEGGVICLAQQSLPLTKTAWAIPVSVL